MKSDTAVKAAKLSLFAVVIYLVVVALLHVIKPEVAPSWETLSIYSRGNFGWIMQLNFALLGLGYIALFVALKPQVKSLGGRVGLALLLVAGLGSIVGGIGVSDPMLTPQSELSTSAMIHGIGAGLAAWFAPLAAIFVSLNIARKNEQWREAKRPLLVAMSIAILGLVVFMGGAMIYGHNGPDTAMGWLNRIAAVCYAAWQVTVSILIVKVLRNK